MTSLYELTKEFADIYRELSEQEFDEETIRNTLDGLGLGDLKGKFQSVAKMIDSLDASAESQKALAKSMNDRAKRNTERAEWLREYLLNAMQSVGMESFDTDTHVFSVRTGTGAVVILDEDMIPPQFQRVLESVVVNKLAIKEAGGCAGAEIVYTKKPKWRLK